MKLLTLLMGLTASFAHADNNSLNETQVWQCSAQCSMVRPLEGYAYSNEYTASRSYQSTGETPLAALNDIKDQCKKDPANKSWRILETVIRFERKFRPLNRSTYDVVTTVATPGNACANISL